MINQYFEFQTLQILNLFNFIDCFLFRLHKRCTASHYFYYNLIINNLFSQFLLFQMKILLISIYHFQILLNFLVILLRCLIICHLYRLINYLMIHICKLDHFLICNLIHPWNFDLKMDFNRVPTVIRTVRKRFFQKF